MAKAWGSKVERASPKFYPQYFHFLDLPGGLIISAPASFLTGQLGNRLPTENRDPDLANKTLFPMTGAELGTWSDSSNQSAPQDRCLIPPNIG